MACNLFRQIGKSRRKIQNGMLFSLRMCNSETYRPSSTEQSSNQSDQATTYGAPEYFQYNEYSFNDIHADMDKYRLPRLSCKTSSEEKKAAEAGFTARKATMQYRLRRFAVPLAAN